jgi:hypothetical protein
MCDLGTNLGRKLGGELGSSERERKRGSLRAGDRARIIHHSVDGGWNSRV